MFNQVTAEIIKNVPHVSGMTEKELPQFLSRTYARIISLRAKYNKEQIPFGDKELLEDWNKLCELSNTLELYLFSDKYPEHKSSLAYVAASARKLMAMIPTENKATPLDLMFVPDDLYAILLFIISGNFADAQEVVSKVNFNSIPNNLTKLLYKSIGFLVGGRLLPILEINTDNVEVCDDLNIALEEMMWLELIKGIKSISSSLLGQGVYSETYFQKVRELSVYQFVESTIKDIYVAPYILSSLLSEAAKVLISHAVINIPVPNGVSKDYWGNAMSIHATIRPYLWDNHLEGVLKGILNKGTSTVITYPTGAGKSTLSELKIISTLLTGQRIIYIVPTHALESQIIYSLEKLQKRIDPIANNLDGEFSIFDEEEEKDIMVMTPERCLALTRVSPEKLGNVGLVVFDEFHIIHGDNRNSRADGAMLLLLELFHILPSADYCFISAMVRNGKEIASWVSSVTSRECILMDSPWKPTCQLQGCLMYEGKQLEELQELISQYRKENPQRRNAPVKLNRQMQATPLCMFSLKTVWDSLDVNDYYLGEIDNGKISLKVGKYWRLSSNYNEVAVTLAAKFATIGLKTIVFALSPKDATSICKKVNEVVGEDKLMFLKSKFPEKLRALEMELGNLSASYLSNCLSASLHHGRLLPEERFLSERYFMHSDGVNVMVATPTLAQGINLPADIVLIAGSSRFNELTGTRENIYAHEILNAAGRAGRAGFRSHGTAILIPSEPIAIEGHNVSHEWMRIKEEIFSKGDRCLTIEDPLGNYLNGSVPVDKSTTLRLVKSEEKELSNKLRKSLYAYKMQTEGNSEMLDSQIHQLLSNLDNEEQKEPWLTELLTKTNCAEDLLMSFFSSIDGNFINHIDTVNVETLLLHVCSVIASHPCLMCNVFTRKIIEERIKTNLGLTADEAWTSESVIELFSIVNQYIDGVSLENIEHSLHSTNNVYYANARYFVLHVVPEISYICGTFVQVFLAWIQQAEFQIDIPKDFKVFASCIKEGVSSYDMLMYKYKNRYMRVQCHHEFNQLTD